MTYYRDDYEFDRQQEAIARAIAAAKVVPFPKMVREICAYCDEGRVVVGDGTEYPGGVLCSYCSGLGYLITEQR